jgi:hypothetical protein
MKHPVIDIDNTNPELKLLHAPHGITPSKFSKDYKNAYLLKLGDTYVRDADHVNEILESFRDMPRDTRPLTIKIKVCWDYRIPKASQTKKVRMRLPNMSVQRIHMLNKINPTGMT